MCLVIMFVSVSFCKGVDDVLDVSVILFVVMMNLLYVCVDVVSVSVYVSV